MIAVIQRVFSASVKVNEKNVGKIDKGLLVFLGVAKEDSSLDVDYLVKKITELRIFDDNDGKMNLSAAESQAEFLVVSQFTLLGDCRKGRRPSFDSAADPKKAEVLYEELVQKIKDQGFKVETGTFRAMMDVELVNDGPVTLIVKSKND